MHGSPEYVAAAKGARRRQRIAEDVRQSRPSSATELITDQPGEENTLLASHTRYVADLLRYAATLGKVTIVTMARQGWVEATIEYLMPELNAILDELDITINYASAGFHRRPSYKGQIDEVTVDDISQALKAIAVRSTVKAFYSTARRVCAGGSTRARSWKNVISVGDSSAERHALQDVIFRHKQRDRHGGWKECRCKVVKLLDDPSLEDLSKQLSHLSSFMLDLVMHDGDVDMDMKDMRGGSLVEFCSYRVSPKKSDKNKRGGPLKTAALATW
jgi:hypothetical protein